MAVELNDDVLHRLTDNGLYVLYDMMFMDGEVNVSADFTVAEIVFIAIVRQLIDEQVAIEDGVDAAASHPRRRWHNFSRFD